MAYKKRNRIRLPIYPNDLYYKLLIASAFLDGQSAATGGKKALKLYFDSFGKNKIAYLLETWNKMTAEERIYPDKKRD